MKSIIICTTQRSGSTLFCKDLNLSQNLGQGGEWFYKLGWTKALNNDHEDLQEKLTNLLEICKTKNDIRTIKLMGNYYQKVINNLQKLEPLKKVAFENVLDIVFQKPLYVRIYRINKVKQAISLLISRQTGVYHSFQTENVQPDFSKIDLNIKKVNKVIREINKGELKWDIFFHKKNIKPITITYESYIDDPNYYLQKIANNLEIKINDIDLEKRLNKVSNKINEQYYLNFLRDRESKFHKSNFPLL